MTVVDWVIGHLLKSHHTPGAGTCKAGPNPVDFAPRFTYDGVDPCGRNPLPEVDVASLTLVVMAAGIGSRYGGLKQIEPVGPSGEIVIDYSIYDALRAGFDRVVFIIRRDLEEAFRRKLGRTVERRTEVAYVFQELEAVPSGFRVPAGRTKPWGTGHAILLCRESVRTPFLALNADDFYGRGAFEAMAAYLRGRQDGPDGYAYAMAGYSLSNTLSAHGHVARAACQMTPDGYLSDVRELLRIQRFPDGIKHTVNGADWHPLPEQCVVSMNFWGFTPSIFAELEARFTRFLDERAGDILKAEFLIPEVVGALVREKKARVKVLPVADKWFGVTYPEDRPVVQAAVRELVRTGIYPARLWGA